MLLFATISVRLRIILGALITVSIVISVLVPKPVSALSFSDVQQQLNVLLARIVSLQGQYASAVLAQQDSNKMCPIITKRLALKTSDTEVVALKKYLASAGVLGQNSYTTYFGPLTEAALQKWQCQQGIVCAGTPDSTGYGATGPTTRAALRNCSGALYESSSSATSTSMMPGVVETVASTSSSLTAQLTVNGKSEVSLNVGDAVKYVWSSTNGKTASSQYTTDSPLCGLTSTGPYPWSAGYADSLSGTNTSTLGECLSGHTITVKFTVAGAGTSTSSSIRVRVNPLGAKRACLIDGLTIEHGASQTLYSARSVGTGLSCTSVAQKRTCTDGVLSGETAFQYAGCTAQAAIVPTASLTANGLSNITVNSGDTINYEWTSTNARTASSVFTLDGPACDSTGTGPFPWAAGYGDSLRGSKSTIISECYAGRTIVITYTAIDANAQKATSTLTVKVAKRVAQTSTLKLESPLATKYSPSCFLGPNGTVAQVAYTYKTVLADAYLGPDTPGAPEQYITTPVNQNLRAYVHYPPNFPWGKGAKYPVVATFSGGGFKTGSPVYWMPVANYLASRGVVVVNFQYRLNSRFKLNGAYDATKDAVSAIRWLKKYGSNLNIDPTKIATLGDSAGGHLALITSLVDASAISDETGADALIRPNTTLNMVAYPVANLNLPGTSFSPDISPYHLVTEQNVPKILYLQSTNDAFPQTLYKLAEQFRDKVWSVTGDQSRINLVAFDGNLVPGKQAHGFLTFDAGNMDEPYRAPKEAFAQIDWALQQEGYLPPLGSLAATRDAVNFSSAICTEIAPQYAELLSEYGYSDGPASSDPYWRKKSVW